MSTTTLSVNDKTNPDRKYAEDHKVIQDLNMPEYNNKVVQDHNIPKYNKCDVIRRDAYRETLEVMKSIFIIVTFLLAYKVAGVHDLWIQLVVKYF